MNMKKSYLLLATAAVAFAGCTSDDYVGHEPDTDPALTGSAMGFNLTVPGQTRATLSGEDAAKALNNEFVVFGVKNAVGEAAAQNTFTNYKVTYDATSAGTTESNTNNWEYVGVTPYSNTLVTPSIYESEDTKQTVKYWDYSATNGYTFTAFSGKGFLSGTGAKVEKTITQTDDHNNGYVVTVPSNAALNEIFFSDRKEIAKTDYDKPVVLTFRNFGSKIRVGFYETVPGYSVKIDRFYYDADATAPVTTFMKMKSNPANGEFVAALQNVNSAASDPNKVTVTYYADGANVNQPKVNTGSTSTYQYTLTLGSKLVDETLGVDPSHATWDDGVGGYHLVYPNLDNDKPMLIRCDYTLTADDGSGETIKVKNARVTVPTQYVQWKSNYAYTYLFKISNNTNGTTGEVPSDPDDPDTGDKEGLYPITFDAVVMETADYAQETTTTVATNSVTSYAKDGYVVNKDIYFVNNATTGTEHNVIVVTDTKQETANNATVYSLGSSTAISEGEILAKLTGSKIANLTLTEATGVSLAQYVPSADGTNLDFGANGALKFNTATAGNYAYVYCTTSYEAPTYAEATNYDATGATTYYANTAADGTGVYYTASGIVDEASYNKYVASHKLYTKTSNGTAGVYDVKVFNVK
jgi:hypothetical protein